MRHGWNVPSTKEYAAERTIRMKKYIFLGLAAGAAVALLLVLWRRKALEGTEFQELYDSSSSPKNLFDKAFEESPDKL
jgi:hypothetical protein